MQTVVNRTELMDDVFVYRTYFAFYRVFLSFAVRFVVAFTTRTKSRFFVERHDSEFRCLLPFRRLDACQSHTDISANDYVTHGRYRGWFRFTTSSKRRNLISTGHLSVLSINFNGTVHTSSAVCVSVRTGFRLTRIGPPKSTPSRQELGWAFSHCDDWSRPYIIDANIALLGGRCSIRTAHAAPQRRLAQKWVMKCDNSQHATGRRRSHLLFALLILTFCCSFAVVYITVSADC